MQIDLYTFFVIGTAVGSFLTFLVTYIYVRTKLDKFNPILVISASILPPYTNDNDKTEVTIENIGDKSGNLDGIEVEISCYEDFHLFIELEDMFVMPGEPVSERVRLPDLPIGNHEITFVVAVEHGLFFKKDVYYQKDYQVTIS
ncbi:MAG: hypothetical protein E3J86_11800 [Candidatus Thorarchaeota archaeon]|nr:MAG: hypothetical protein E3J86_11800 [Candidatus Thorarchaeota archaeon]